MKGLSDLEARVEWVDSPCKEFVTWGTTIWSIVHILSSLFLIEELGQYGLVNSRNFQRRNFFGNSYKTVVKNRGAYVLISKESRTTFHLYSSKWYIGELVFICSFDQSLFIWVGFLILMFFKTLSMHFLFLMKNKK